MIEIVVALIVTVPPLLAVVLSNRKTRRENTEQHAQSKQAVDLATVTLAAQTEALKVLGAEVVGTRADVQSVEREVSGLGTRVGRVEKVLDLSPSVGD